MPRTIITNPERHLPIEWTRNERSPRFLPGTMTLRGGFVPAALAAAMLFSVGCTDAGVPVTPADPVDGRGDALVTVVAFGDYQCPYTAKALTTLESVRARYQADEIRIAWKHFPLSFHPEARPAADVAANVFLAGGPEPFWQLSHWMLQSQRDLSPESIDAWASEVRLPVANYQSIAAQALPAAKVDADLELARSLGVRASPTFFIDGLKLEGAQPAESFAASIDRALAQAREAVATGVDRDAVYDTTVQLNLVHDDL